MESSHLFSFADDEARDGEEGNRGRGGWDEERWSPNLFRPCEREMMSNTNQYLNRILPTSKLYPVMSSVQCVLTHFLVPLSLWSWWIWKWNEWVGGSDWMDESNNWSWASSSTTTEYISRTEDEVEHFPSGRLWEDREREIWSEEEEDERRGIRLVSL